MKLTREQKIEIYNKRKEGKTIPSLSNIYGIIEHNVEYIIRLIDMHGIDILRRKENIHLIKELSGK